MISIKYVSGDMFPVILADEGFKTIIIPHVVNCKGGWGAGFVVPLGNTFPAAKERYLEWHKQNQEDGKPGVEMLGNTSIIETKEQENPLIYVAHMCAQTLGGSRPLFYNHLSRCMDAVAKFAVNQSSPEIHAPMFGSGLAGGDWNFVEALIEDAWCKRGLSTTVYYLPGTEPKGWTPPQ